MMKEELKKYLKETFHVTHKGFLKYFLLRTSGEAIPTDELANEVGCCVLSIGHWDSMLEHLGIINQEGVAYYRYIDGTKVDISENDFYTYNKYNQILDLYKALLDLTPFEINEASKRHDTNLAGTELADIFSNLQEGLQAIDMPLTDNDFDITFAPVFEVDKDSEAYINTMLMIARYSVL